MKKEFRMPPHQSGGNCTWLDNKGKIKVWEKITIDSLSREDFLVTGFSLTWGKPVR